MLLEGGADVNLADDSGQTPIHVAAKYGHEALVCSLLQYGADPKVKVKNDGWNLTESVV